MNETDLERRISALEKRFDFLDLHGSRGIGTVQVQLNEQAKDLGKLEQQLNGLQRAIERSTQNRWATFTAYAIALLPMYILLFMAVLGGKTR